MASNRLAVAALLSAMVASLAACGGGGDTQSATAPTAGGDPPAPAPSPTSSALPAPAPAPAPALPLTAALTWSASVASDVAGYRVYYGTSSRSYTQVKGAGLVAGNVTSMTVSGLQSGKTYYFAVTAFDAAGNESNYSSEVFKVIP